MQLKWFSLNSYNMPKPEIKRDTVTLDAEGKVLGRLATEIAVLLMGKNKPDYLPNLDAGAIVEVENVGKMKLTGNKINYKVYQHHSGYPGGVKTRKAADLMESNPGEVLKMAVDRMLPKNTFRSRRMKRLRIK